MVKSKVSNKNKGILQVTVTVCISFTNDMSHIKVCDVLWIDKSVWALLQTRQVAMKLNSSFILFSRKHLKDQPHWIMKNKGSPAPAWNICSDSETFAANFVMDWNVHGDKWQSPHWREKIAQASAKLQRFIHCHCLHGFLSLSPRIVQVSHFNSESWSQQAPEGRSRQVSSLINWISENIPNFIWLISRRLQKREEEG